MLCWTNTRLSPALRTPGAYVALITSATFSMSASSRWERKALSFVTTPSYAPSLILFMIAGWFRSTSFMMSTAQSLRVRAYLQKPKRKFLVDALFDQSGSSMCFMAQLYHNSVRDCHIGRREGIAQ